MTDDNERNNSKGIYFTVYNIFLSYIYIYIYIYSIMAEASASVPTSSEGGSGSGRRRRRKRREECQASSKSSSFSSSSRGGEDSFGNGSASAGANARGKKQARRTTTTSSSSRHGKLSGNPVVVGHDSSSSKSGGVGGVTRPLRSKPHRGGRGGSVSRRCEKVPGAERISKRAPQRHATSERDIFINRNSPFNAQLARAEKLLARCGGGGVDGSSVIVVHGLGAAINRALNLALRLQQRSLKPITLSVETDTIDLIDDVTDANGDSVKMRRNSAVHITITSKPLAE